VTGPTLPQVVFSLRIGPAVAVFLALAAIDHLLVASPGVHGWYERGLSRRANYARWIEYSISASVMIVLIGLFVGIRDLAAVVAIFAVNTAMILSGLLMERQQRPGAADWSAFAFGSLVGIVPWALIGVYVAQPARCRGSSTPSPSSSSCCSSASRSIWRSSTPGSGAGATTSTARSSTSS
jgi:bacteriorhodopsin